MVLFDPPISIAIRLECLRGLRHGRFDRRTALTFIESECGDVYQCRNVWIVAGLGDDGPAVAMADQDDRPSHGVDGGLRVFLVVGVGGLRRLRHRDRVAILLKDLCDGVPAGAIGECTMHQNHVFDASRRRGTCRGGDQSCAHQHSNDCNPVSLLHDHVLSGLSFSESCIEPQTCTGPYPETSDDTIENMNHFCGFLLQMWSEGGRKTTSGLSSMRRL
jgi:hypothetical protein